MDDTYLYIRPIMRMCHLRYQVIGCGQQLKKFVQRLVLVAHQEEVIMQLKEYLFFVHKMYIMIDSFMMT